MLGKRNFKVNNEFKFNNFENLHENIMKNEIDKTTPI